MNLKPSGNVGVNRIVVGQNSVELSWEKISFPLKKDEIEKYFCGRFIYQFLKSDGKLYRVDQNKENDLDFILSIPGGKVFLELGEIVLRSTKGSPYNSESINISYREYTDSVYKIIEDKSFKYQSISRIPIHLLLYYTHWRFTPSNNLISMLQYDLQSKKHIFENIFLYCPIDSKEGELRVLFPVKNKCFRSMDFEKIRDTEYLNLHPAKFELFKK